MTLAPGLSWRWRETLVPLLLSPDHGLLFYQPWIVLGLAMCLPQIRRLVPNSEPGDPPAGWHWVCAAAIVLHLTLIASWNCWWGGRLLGFPVGDGDNTLFRSALSVPSPSYALLAWGRRVLLATTLVAAFVHLTGVYLKADYRDIQPGLFSIAPSRPVPGRTCRFSGRSPP